jgi:hypothetical protein
MSFNAQPGGYLMAVPMTVPMAVPAVAAYLPELTHFVEGLRQEVEAATLSDWPNLSAKIHQFFTPAMTEKVNATIPGWRAMAAEAEGVTQVHVMSVFVSLLRCPEYMQASREQQLLLQWIVLFHDVAKVVRNGKRDPTHAFRSAAMTAGQLPHLGFAVTDNFAACIEDWASLTSGAVINQPEIHENIPDNSKPPQILDGIERMFGHDTPGALVVKTVLLHLSINVVKAWPQAAALTEDEMRQYFSDPLLPLLKIMMLVDNDAYAFFDPAEKLKARAETLAAFEKVAKIIHRP